MRNKRTAVFNRSNYTTPLRWPKQFLYDLKCCIDRSQKGYCEDDLWRMSDWFLDTVPNMLDELVQKRCGFPGYLEREYYDEHKETLGMSYDEFICWPDDETSEGYKIREQANKACDDRWGDILKEIAFYLHEAKIDDETPLTNGKGVAYRIDCLHKGLELFKKHFEDFWD